MTKAQPDHGPPERQQHGDAIELHETERAGLKRAYVTTQTPLERYKARGQLGDGSTAERRLEAGNRLYRDFYTSGLHTRTTGSYQTKLSGGSQEGYQILCLQAYRDYMRATSKIRDGCLDVIRSVVCYHERAGGGARMECLRIGLDDLASAYGLR